jgi:hypothetical protein
VWRQGALYQSFSHVGEEAKFRTRTEDRLTTIEGDVKGIHSALQELRLLQLSQNPTNPHNAKQTKALLVEARAKHLKLDAAVIEASGDRFIDSASRARLVANGQPVCVLSFIPKHRFSAEAFRRKASTTRRRLRAHIQSEAEAWCANAYPGA